MESLSALVECPDWHQGSMLAAIVVAVVGVAIAFFSQSIFAGVGFALLGVTGGLGLWISQDALDAAQLKATLSKVADDNKQLEAAHKAEQVLTKRYRDETVRLEGLTRDFGRQVTDLRGVNESLTLSKGALEEASRALGVRNQELETQNGVLQQRVVDLTRLLEGLKQQVQQFLQETVRFGEIEGAFQGTVTALHQDTLQIEGVERAFHVDLTKLTDHLASAKTEYQQFMTFFYREKEAVADQIKDVVAATSRLQAVEELLTLKMEELSEQERRIRESGEKLTLVKLELSQMEVKFHGTQEVYIAQCQNLAREREALARACQDFEAASQALMKLKKG